MRTLVVCSQGDKSIQSAWSIDWAAAHRAFAVEEYFKNNESLVKTRRLFRRHFSIHANVSVI
jgi:hypothetical protein